MALIKIIGTAHPYRGGLAAFNERLAFEYIKHGHSVEIETFKLQYPGFLFPGKTQYANWDAPEGLKISRTVNSISPFNWFKVGRRLRKENIDLLIFKFWLPLMGPCFGVISRLARKNKRTKSISILDNIIPHEKRPGDKVFTSFFVKSMDGFIAMSNSVLKDIDIFNQTLPRRYSPHPVFDNFGEKLKPSQALDDLSLDPEFKYILFFGLVREYKGLDLLIEAMSLIKDKLSNIKVLVAGEFYDDINNYLELIKKYQLEDIFVLHPEFIEDNMVNRWFCASNLVVQPYKTATQSGVTQIGYHFEIPMLVTDVGGLSEIISHKKAGYVVKPEPSRIASAITDYFLNSREEEYRQGLKEEKEKFQWNKMVKNISLLINEGI